MRIHNMISTWAIYVTCNLGCCYGKKMHDMLERQPHDNAQPNHNFYWQPPLVFVEAWICNDSRINFVVLELEKTRCFRHGEWILWSWKPTHSKQVCHRKIQGHVFLSSDRLVILTLGQFETTTPPPPEAKSSTFNFKVNSKSQSDSATSMQWPYLPNTRSQTDGQEAANLRGQKCLSLLHTSKKN